MSNQSIPAKHVLTILAVDNLDVSGRFYDHVFGWERTVEVPVYIEYSLPGGQRIGLYHRDGFARNTGAPSLPSPSGPATTSTELYFHVEEPLTVIERLKTAGARELSPLAMRDWGEEAAYFIDPDGNVLVIAKLR